MKRIIYDYEKPHIVGRARGTGSLAKIIIGVLVIFFLILLAYVVFFKAENSSSVEAESVFLVYLEAESESDAQAESEIIKSMGGGGYVEKSRVYVAVYLAEDEAKTVAQRYDYNVEKIENSLVSADRFGGDNKKVTKLLQYPLDALKNLNSVCILLDKKEVSEDAALYALYDLKNNAVENLSDIKKLIEDYSSDNLLNETKTSYENIIKVLESKNQYSVSSRLKYCQIEIAFIYRNLLKTIS